MSCRVDFYVQSGGPAQGHLTLACRVTEKAFQAGHQVYLRCDDMTQAEELDTLLWTFSQCSFVPHHLHGVDDDPAPVTIGHGPPDSAQVQVVVSVAGKPITNFADFARVAEIVGSEEIEKQSGRARFKFYRENGVEPATHEIRL